MLMCRQRRAAVSHLSVGQMLSNHLKCYFDVWALTASWLREFFLHTTKWVMSNLLSRQWTAAKFKFHTISPERKHLKTATPTLPIVGAVWETVCISHQNFDWPLHVNVKSGLNWLNEFRLVNGMNLSRTPFSVAALVCDLKWEDMNFS